MDEDLKKLVEELRRETCPQRVIDEVARRLPGKQPSRLRIEFAAACTAVLLLAGWGLWRLSEDRVAPPPPSGGSAVATDSTRAARQAEVALGCLGIALRDAGTRSEEAILRTTVPRLRNSLQIAKNKIINHI